VLGARDGRLPRGRVIVDRLVRFRGLVVDVDITVLNARDVFNDTMNALKDVARNVSVATFNLEIDNDLIVLTHRDVFDNAKRDNVATESGVLDSRQSSTD
jgi:hypothetical protein